MNSVWYQIVYVKMTHELTNKLVHSTSFLVYLRRVREDCPNTQYPLGIPRDCNVT